MTTKETEKEVEDLIAKVGTGGIDERWATIKALRPMLGDSFPTRMLDLYRLARTWEVRVACVYHCLKEGRDGYDDAFQLGLEALKDKSKVVRYRACMLLSFAQRDEALPYLRALLEDAGKAASHADALAAIDAIENKNRHYFVDRKHTDKIFMN